MDSFTFWSAISENIITPLLVVIGGAIVVFGKYYADKIVKILIAKNEIADMEKQSTVRKDLMTNISTIVESAVASNMQMADSMKKSGTKLTEDQIMELNTSAKQVIMNSLPTDLTEEGGVLLEIIGGKEKLDSIIDSMIEKYVYEYKIKSANKKAQSTKTNDRSVTLTRNLQTDRFR